MKIFVVSLVSVVESSFLINFCKYCCHCCFLKRNIGFLIACSCRDCFKLRIVLQFETQVQRDV